MKIRRPSSHHDAQALLDYGDRIVDGDTTPPTSDLESTYLRVQRAMRANQSVPGSMPDHLRMRAWENVMQNTAIAPARGSTRPGNRYRAIPGAPLSRMAWTGAANIALAVLLVVLAGLGVWRAFDGGFGGGGNGPAPSEGRYAQAPMTPVPEATALAGNAATSCDFGAEVPVYNGVFEPPVDGTVLYVTTSHELKMHCAEEREDIVLADDVDHATATHWPGVVNLGIGADATFPAPVFLNVLTNERIEYGRENSAMTRQGTMYATLRSPFVVTAMPDDPSTWALTDLRSMSTRSLSDLAGVEWPRNSDVYVAENGTQGTYSISVFNPSLTLEDGPALLQADGFPGEIMLISGSLDNVSWIDVPDDLTSPYSVHISPDGEHIAVVDMPRPQSPGKATIAILRTSDGAEVTRTDEFNHSQMPDIFWVNDGNALVYAQSGSVMTLQAEEGSAPQALLESDERLFDLRATNDPDVLTVSESGASSGEWRGESDRVYAINTRTDDVEAFEGRVWQPGTYTHPALRTQSVTILVDDESGQDGSTTVIDPATGETLLDLPFMPITGGNSSERFPNDSLALSINRGTTAFTIREQETLIVINVSGDGSGAREIPFPDFTPPDEDWSTQVDFSPDGTYLLFSIYNESVNTLWVMDLDASGAMWKEVPGETFVTYMPAMP